MVTPARVVSEYNALQDDGLRIALRKIWRDYNRPAVVWDFKRYFGSVTNIASTATYQTVHEAGERIIEVRATNDIVRVVSTSAEDTGELIVQAKGGTRRALLNISAKAGDASIENIMPGILIEPQSLVQVVCASSAANVEAAAEFTVWEIIDPASRGDYA